MTSLEKDSLVPTITDLHALLKSAFSSMTKEDQHLYQSILMDILVLQPWSRKLDSAEVKALTRMENLVKSRSKLMDLTQEDNGDSDDEGSFTKLTFQPIPLSLHQGKKLPVANVPSTPLTTAATTSTKTPQSKQSAEKMLGTDEDDTHRSRNEKVSSKITDDKETSDSTESDGEPADNQAQNSENDDFETSKPKGNRIHIL